MLSGEELDLHAVTDRSAAAGSGIPHAEALVTFAEAVVGGDELQVATARQVLLDAVGPEALVDAAAVAANFERMDRIADATGIPLDAPMDLLTADLRSELGIDSFASSVNSPASGVLKRALAPLLRPLGLRVLKIVARSIARQNAS